MYKILENFVCVHLILYAHISHSTIYIMRVIIDNCEKIYN